MVVLLTPAKMRATCIRKNLVSLPHSSQKNRAAGKGWEALMFPPRVRVDVQTQLNLMEREIQLGIEPQSSVNRASTGYTRLFICPKQFGRDSVEYLSQARTQERKDLQHGLKRVPPDIPSSFAPSNWELSAPLWIGIYATS